MLISVLCVSIRGSSVPSVGHAVLIHSVQYGPRPLMPLYVEPYDRTPRSYANSQVDEMALPRCSSCAGSCHPHHPQDPFAVLPKSSNLLASTTASYFWIYVCSFIVLFFMIGSPAQHKRACFPIHKPHTVFFSQLNCCCPDCSAWLFVKSLLPAFFCTSKEHLKSALALNIYTLRNLMMCCRSSIPCSTDCRHEKCYRRIILGSTSFYWCVNAKPRTKKKGLRILLFWSKSLVKKENRCIRLTTGAC